MFRRIEIQMKDGKWYGCGVDPRCGAYMQMEDLYEPCVPNGLHVQFWFTEAGWEKIGNPLHTEMLQVGIDCRVLEVEDFRKIAYCDNLQIAIEIGRDQAKLEKSRWLYEDPMLGKPAPYGEKESDWTFEY